MTKEEWIDKAVAHIYSTGSCAPIALGNLNPVISKQKDNNMYNAISMDSKVSTQELELKQLSYLKKRLYDVENAQKNKNRGRFHLDTPRGPRTIKEARELLTSGQFTFHWEGDEDKVMSSHDSPFCYFSWRKPGEKEDLEGWKAFKKQLEKDVTDVEDTIMVKSPEEALEAIKALEAKVYS